MAIALCPRDCFLRRGGTGEDELAAQKCGIGVNNDVRLNGVALIRPA